jgi:thiamine pyrophosphate-dependent acetolactate synthase large subunit-like protein
MTVIGSDLVARALKQQGVRDFFFIMGGPMLDVESACLAEGLRGIDVRHEQAGAMAAHAYARLLNRPGVCMGASGPGMTNLITGVAHAWADRTPVLALGGASPNATRGRGVFQEIDQLAMMQPCTKWADRVLDPHRIPELINRAIREAMGGQVGPVYLDLPGDVLYQEVDEAQVVWPEPWDPGKRSRPAGDPAQIKAAVELLAAAEAPVLLSGSGILWSEAQAALQAFVEAAGIPFYTTPQSRGVIPEDHDYCYLTARGTAFREADLILVVGTRLNYVVGHGAPPRFNAEAKLVRVDIDPAEIAGGGRADIAIAGDARAVLAQLTEAAQGRLSPQSFAAWRERLRGRNDSRAAENEARLNSADVPIHPLRLCREVRDFMARDGVLVVDGQEILNFGRQSIPTHTAGHRINSGVFGTMGVGLPCGLGAKAAKPDAQVVVLHGDGSFGLNAMELDTCVRHGLPVLVVLSNNGGWTADPDGTKPGRDLGYTRYDKLAEALGGYGEHVTEPDGIRPALQRAWEKVQAGTPALVNVETDGKARATTADFTRYVT